MITYPLVVPGTHPAAEGIFGEEVYVEALLKGPTVGFAAFGETLWVDMPIDKVGLLDNKELNAQYQYIGVVLENGITLTDVLTRSGPLDHEAKFVEADRLGIECVQLLHAGALTDGEQVQGFLQQSPSGIIIKPIKVPPQMRLLYVEITSDMFVQPTDGEVPNV